MTGADVAKLAGVSAATVSYVLNDKPGQTIPESTRARVREAAAQLGYRPNAAARSLRVGRSDVVVGLIPDVGYGATFQGLMADLAEQLARMGLALVLHPAPADVGRLRDLLVTINPVAVVGLTAVADEVVQMLQGAGVRVVVGTAQARGSRPWELRFGGGEFGAAQAGHLRARGHVRIGLVAWARESPSATDLGRADALLAVMRDAGQADVPVLKLPQDPAAAEPALRDWLLAEPDVTAVATMSDDVAALVVSTADRIGVAVPGRLAVIGAYDFPVCTLVRPTLSTVRTDTAALIARFAEIIRDAVHDPTSPLPPGIPVTTATVVPREST
ncbi:DNA-binding transcriptional regulator, LacI/PurR family [Klenkia brasiliensis]|uniref:DNA-binding transcriptional regulator, LacI/PurR family n=1 Tax=Klenkia brasiliensis TaxID=333142 RepID=A0A1G7Q5N9_9ACTN|nr:DNA-binding transcriptional regulator, LacI/PurR family [Klenkia brasiliensis]